MYLCIISNFVEYFVIDQHFFEQIFRKVEPENFLYEFLNSGDPPYPRMWSECNEADHRDVKIWKSNLYLIYINAFSFEISILFIQASYTESSKSKKNKIRMDKNIY